MSNEFKRVKHRQMPGDIPRRFKIAMREKRFPIIVRFGHEITAQAAKSFRKRLTKRGRAVQRRRDKRAEEDY